MIIPYTVDVPMHRYPIANWVLIAFTIVIGAVVLLGDQPSPTLTVPGVDDATMAELRQIVGNTVWWEAWILRRDGFAIQQLFGCLFVHGGFIHLFGNMIFLFCFGNAVNAKLGHILYILSYFFLGGVAGLGWLALGTGPAAIGASGAIMGIVGIFLVLFPRNDVYVLYFFWFFYFFRAGTFQLSSYWVILAYIAFDVSGIAGLGSDGVAYSAHVAGALGGILLAVLLLTTRIVQSTDTEQNLLQLLNIQRR